METAVLTDNSVVMALGPKTRLPRVSEVKAVVVDYEKSQQELFRAVCPEHTFGEKVFERQMLCQQLGITSLQQKVEVALMPVGEGYTVRMLQSLLHGNVDWRFSNFREATAHEGLPSEDRFKVRPALFILGTYLVEGGLPSETNFLTLKDVSRGMRSLGVAEVQVKENVDTMFSIPLTLIRRR